MFNLLGKEAGLDEITSLGELDSLKHDLNIGPRNSIASTAPGSGTSSCASNSDTSDADF